MIQREPEPLPPALVPLTAVTRDIDDAQIAATDNYALHTSCEEFTYLLKC